MVDVGDDGDVADRTRHFGKAAGSEKGREITSSGGVMRA
jgi:hypothetical protein